MTPEEAADKVYAVSGVVLGTDKARHIASYITVMEDRIKALEDSLQWFVDNDETNQGDIPMPERGNQTWNEINAYWIDGLNRARDLLKGKGND